MRALSTIAKGDATRIADARRVVVRTPDEWTTLWAAHAGPESEPPAVNFASAIVAAAFAGRQAARQRAIEIVGAVEEDGGTRLVVEERRTGAEPASGAPPAAPFHIVMLPRVDGEIRWTDGAHAHASDATDPTVRLAHAAHSRKSATGLRPRTAGVLAYLAGPVSGVIMLVAEPDQPFVRFHAWQSLIALGALSLAVAACYGAAFASLFFTANGLSIMVRVATVVWIALLVLWAVLMWQAWKGRAWKLPIAGAWAEGLAARRSNPRAPGTLNSQGPTSNSQDS